MCDILVVPKCSWWKEDFDYVIKATPKDGCHATIDTCLNVPFSLIFMVSISVTNISLITLPNHIKTGYKTQRVSEGEQGALSSCS